MYGLFVCVRRTCYARVCVCMRTLDYQRQCVDLEYSASGLGNPPDLIPSLPLCHSRRQYSRNLQSLQSICSKKWHHKNKGDEQQDVKRYTFTVTLAIASLSEAWQQMCVHCLRHRQRGGGFGSTAGLTGGD